MHFFWWALQFSVVKVELAISRWKFVILASMERHPKAVVYRLIARTSCLKIFFLISKVVVVILYKQLVFCKCRHTIVCFWILHFGCIFAIKSDTWVSRLSKPSATASLTDDGINLFQDGCTHTLEDRPLLQCLIMCGLWILFLLKNVVTWE